MAQDNLPALARDFSAARTASETTRPGLWRLLTDTEDREGALRLISINPTLKAEVLAVAPELQRRAQPMEPTRIAARLSKLAIQMGLPDRDHREWAVMLEAYVSTLAKVPEEALEAAILAWNQCELYPKEPGRHAFFPRPAELFALAEKSHAKLAMAAYRARLATEKVAAAPKVEPTADERAARRQELIDEGILDENGKVRFDKRPPDLGPARSRESPQALAERLRNLQSPPSAGVEEAI